MTAESPDIERDRVTVGVTATGAANLEAVMATGWFTEEVDAYRSAVALALKLGMTPLATLTGVQTKYNVGTLDRDGKLAQLVRLMAPAAGARPYEYVERLADAGLGALRARLVDGGALLSETLASPAVAQDEP
jgi:hypothetical protein